MKKIESPFEAMEILKDELPKCFKRGAQKFPLAIGIHESVLKHYRNDDRFEAEVLKNAIRFYCKGAKYIASIVEGAPRIDINGNAASTVKKSEAQYALKTLAGKKTRNKNQKKLVK